MRRDPLRRRTFGKPARHDARHRVVRIVDADEAAVAIDAFRHEHGGRTRGDELRRVFRIGEKTDMALGRFIERSNADHARIARSAVRAADEIDNFSQRDIRHSGAHSTKD